MKPALFEYTAPSSVDEALAALASRPDDAKVLAGGQSLVPLMNMRLARPGLVVDINRIASLGYVRVEDGELAVGALARHASVLAEPAVGRDWPLLHEATEQVGHPAIRNRGTVVGSLAHADPAAEHPAVLAALDGRLVIAGPDGRRQATADEFFITYLTTALEPTEMVVEARFPRLPAGAGTCFLEFSRRHGDFAIVGVAAALALEGGVCRDARLALTGVGGVPFRARDAEAALRGRSLDAAGADDAFREAAELVRGGVEPDDDIHASAGFRRHLAAVLTTRALRTALQRTTTASGGQSGNRPPAPRQR